MATDLGLAAGATAGADRAVEEMGQDRVARFGRRRRGEGGAYLAEDLVLAHDQRFDTSRHPEKVRGGARPRQVIEGSAFGCTLTLRPRDRRNHCRGFQVMSFR